MSSIAAWSYTQLLTIWPFVSEDEYNQPTFGAPYTIIGSWEVGGGTQVSDSGEEFTAMSTYYFEAAEDSALIPSQTDYILKGDNTGTADPIAAGAEEIKKVGGWDMGMFGSTEIPDWKINT